jgi:hypothetical protein
MPEYEVFHDIIRYQAIEIRYFPVFAVFVRSACRTWPNYMWPC